MHITQPVAVKRVGLLSLKHAHEGNYNFLVGVLFYFQFLFLQDQHYNGRYIRC